MKHEHEMFKSSMMSRGIIMCWFKLFNPLSTLYRALIAILGNSKFKLSYEGILHDFFSIF